MPTGQYFDREPVAASQPRQVLLSLPDVVITLETDRGVFAGRGVDPGTRLLLGEAPPPPAGGDLLDLGCGYGPIALALAVRAPAARVWAVDVNQRALDLCRRNAAAAGIANVVVAAPDEVDPAVRFAAIYSNPPIRVGKVGLHQMLAGWLARLAPGGRAFLVVQKHLGSDSLQTWLAGEGWAVSRRIARRGYRVLEVSR